jgi:hypothetical protein
VSVVTQTYNYSRLFKYNGNRLSYIYFDIQDTKDNNVFIKKYKERYAYNSNGLIKEIKREDDSISNRYYDFKVANGDEYTYTIEYRDPSKNINNTMTLTNPRIYLQYQEYSKITDDGESVFFEDFFISEKSKYYINIENIRNKNSNYDRIYINKDKYTDVYQFIKDGKIECTVTVAYEDGYGNCDYFSDEE